MKLSKPSHTPLLHLTDACRPAPWVDALMNRRALCEGRVEYFRTSPINAQGRTEISSWREWSKKSVQQGRSQFVARSVQRVCEHGERARTPLAIFFIIPLITKEILKGGDVTHRGSVGHGFVRNDWKMRGLYNELGYGFFGGPIRPSAVGTSSC